MAVRRRAEASASAVGNLPLDGSGRWKVGAPRSVTKFLPRSRSAQLSGALSRLSRSREPMSVVVVDEYELVRLMLVDC